MVTFSREGSKAQLVAGSTVTSAVEGKFFKLYIDKVLHLSIYLDNYIAMQAWMETVDWFCVNIYMTELEDPILLEYNDQKRWEAVVSLLNENL